MITLVCIGIHYHQEKTYVFKPMKIKKKVIKTKSKKIQKRNLSVGSKTTNPNDVFLAGVSVDYKLKPNEVFLAGKLGGKGETEKGHKRTKYKGADSGVAEILTEVITLITLITLIILIIRQDNPSR